MKRKSQFESVHIKVKYFKYDESDLSASFECELTNPINDNNKESDSSKDGECEKQLFSTNEKLDASGETVKNIKNDDSDRLNTNAHELKHPEHDEVDNFFYHFDEPEEYTCNQCLDNTDYSDSDQLSNRTDTEENKFSACDTEDFAKEKNTVDDTETKAKL